jgi:SAM-dependent methyltransferase
MGKLLQIVTPIHQSTQRDYLGRMIDNKASCMVVAKKYDKDYWDGDRRYGYGGYRYIPGRLESIAKKLIEQYGLNSNSKILDVGCGKGYLLYEFFKLTPGAELRGIDASSYAINNAKEEIKEFLTIARAEEVLPFETKTFDLVISLGTFHNLKMRDLPLALSELERVGNSKYLMLESYRNEQELFNLQCWALTAESFFDVDDWLWLYNKFGYSGDYEFIFFE